MTTRNIRVEIDLGCSFHWTDDPPDGEYVFATLDEARARAILTMREEIRNWQAGIRDAKETTEEDVR